MSDRLAVSAAFSILVMSIYVLFGGDAVRLPLGPEQFESPSAIAESGMPGGRASLSPFSR